MYKRNIAEKNILITGAGTGIGREVAIGLSALGARLVLVGRTEETLRESSQLCHMHFQEKNQREGEIHYYIADISVWEEAQRAVTYAQKKLSGIDIVIANAGRSMHAPAKECMLEVFEAMMESNYFTAVNIIQHSLAHIIKCKGTICAITSIQAVVGVPNHAPYAAAKHAVSGYLDAIDLEHPEISVVEILPGWVYGTALRSKAIDGMGRILTSRNSHRRHSRGSVSVEECARTTIRAIVRKKRYAYLPNFWKNILLAKFFFRRTLKRIIIKRQHYSSS